MQKNPTLKEVRKALQQLVKEGILIRRIIDGVEYWQDRKVYEKQN